MGPKKGGAAVGPPAGTVPGSGCPPLGTWDFREMHRMPSKGGGADRGFIQQRQRREPPCKPPPQVRQGLDVAWWQSSPVVPRGPDGCVGGGGFLMRTTTVGFTELDTEHFCVNCPQLEGEEEAQLVLETSGGKAEKQFLLST